MRQSPIAAVNSLIFRLESADNDAGKSVTPGEGEKRARQRDVAAGLPRHFPGGITPPYGEVNSPLHLALAELWEEHAALRAVLGRSEKPMGAPRVAAATDQAERVPDTFPPNSPGV
ncbi:MAG: hypothetical protein WAO35_14345 [Terriglobia bacterium]